MSPRQAHLAACPTERVIQKHCQAAGCQQQGKEEAAGEEAAGEEAAGQEEEEEETAGKALAVVRHIFRQLLPALTYDQQVGRGQHGNACMKRTCSLATCPPTCLRTLCHCPLWHCAGGTSISLLPQRLPDACTCHSLARSIKCWAAPGCTSTCALSVRASNSQSWLQPHCLSPPPQ
jgi:hypothetical protein